jgi:hypothetical protein
MSSGCQLEDRRLGVEIGDGAEQVSAEPPHPPRRLLTAWTVVSAVIFTGAPGADNLVSIITASPVPRLVTTTTPGAWDTSNAPLKGPATLEISPTTRFT